MFLVRHGTALASVPTQSDRPEEASVADLPTRTRGNGVPHEWKSLTVGLIARQFGEPMPEIHGHRLEPVGTREERMAWFDGLRDTPPPSTAPTNGVEPVC